MGAHLVLPFLFIYYYGSSLSIKIKCSYTKLFATHNPICIIATLLYKILSLSTPIHTHIYGKLPPCSKQHGPLKILT